MRARGTRSMGSPARAQELPPEPFARPDTQSHAEPASPPVAPPASALAAVIEVQAIVDDHRTRCTRSHTRVF